MATRTKQGEKQYLKPLPGQLTDAQIRREWKTNGGDMSGPNVETVHMPEAWYFTFRRKLQPQANGAIFTKTLVLQDLGIYVGPRDPNRNKAFKGAWMVCENPKFGSHTQDSSIGGYCIVGDDLHKLINTAFTDRVING